MTENPAGRRLFFRYMARETVVWFEELCGRPHVLISDVAKLPPERLRGVIPRIGPGVQIIPEQERVCARLPDQTQPVEVLRTDEAGLFVFNRFNGQKQLQEIAEELGAAMTWPPERSFAFVREFFLKLLVMRVCVPAKPLDTQPAPNAAVGPG